MSNRITDRLIPSSIAAANRASRNLRLVIDILAPLGIVGLPDQIERKRRSAFYDVKEALSLSMQAAEQLTDVHTLLTASEQSMTPTDQAVYALEDVEMSARDAAVKLWALLEALENLNAAELPARTHDRLKTLTEQAKRYQGGLYTVGTNLNALRQELEGQDEK